MKINLILNYNLKQYLNQAF